MRARASRKLTRTDRRRRQARNDRRGRHPAPRPPRPAVRARYYRYAGYVVRVYRGNLQVVRVGIEPCRARPGMFPRAAATLAPLPPRLRREVRAEADDRQRRARMEDLGLELPAKDVWTTPSGVRA